MTVPEQKWNTLPKIELHCHLDGSLSRDYLTRMLGREVAETEVQVQEDCGSLKEYLEKFDLPLQCLRRAEQFEEAGYDLLQSVSAEQVRYMEVRFAPQISAGDGLSVEQILEALLKGLARGKKDFGVESNVIVCAMRHMPEEINLAMIRSAREFLGKGVCAADLAGDEKAFPMAQFLNLFGEVRRMGMPFVIHAGECGSVQNIVDAVECGARRIGHGISMYRDPAVRKLCLERRIGIEMCPVSNMQTKAIENPAEYPIREYLREGLLATLNTDNRTVSNTTLTREIGFVQEHYELTEEEIHVLMRNAIEVSFAADDVKQRLWKMMP